MDALMAIAEYKVWYVIIPLIIILLRRFIARRFQPGFKLPPLLFRK